MKKIFILFVISIMSFAAKAQTFKLNFSSVEKFLAPNYTLAKVKAALLPNYTLVKQGESEWKFRDDNKSWEATLYAQFDKSTKKINEIQFSAPNTRVFELMDELEKELGYKLVGTEGQMDIFENASKKYGAKIVPANFLGQGMVLFRIYKL